jgi:hypothetical protein
MLGYAICKTFVPSTLFSFSISQLAAAWSEKGKTRCKHALGCMCFTIAAGISKKSIAILLAALAFTALALNSCKGIKVREKGSGLPQEFLKERKP